jgi:TP901 family phage tail tape measure protein
MGMTPNGVDLGSAYGRILVTTNMQEAVQEARSALRSGVQGMSSSLQNLGSTVSSIGMEIAALTAPLAGLGVAGVASLASYDDLMTQISARTGLVGDELQSVGEYAKEMGAATVFSTEQALDAFLDLLTSGQSVEEAFETLPQVLDLAAAGSLDLGYAADTVTDIMAQFQLEVDKSQTVVDALARAASSSSADVGMLADGFANVGPVAAQFGLSVEETAATLATFAENGIKGAEAGTQLRSMLLNMTRNTEPVQAAWRELGINLYDAEGNMRNLDDIIDDLGVALEDLPMEDQNRLLQAIGGSYGIVGLSALLAAGGIDEMQESMSEQVSASDVAAQMMESLRNKTNSLKGTIQTLLITALEPFLEQIKDGIGDTDSGLIGFINGITEWVKANPELAGSIVKVLAALTALGPVLLVIGQVISFAGTAVGVLGGMFVALTSPIGLAIAAIVAMGVAYRTNFLGFRDLVLSIFPGIDQTFTNIRDGVSRLVQTFGWFIQDIRDFGIGQAIAGVFGQGTAAMELMESSLEGILVTFGVSRSRAVALTHTLWVLVNMIRDNVIGAFNSVRSGLIRLWTDTSPQLTLLREWFTTTALPAIRQAISTLFLSGLRDGTQGLKNLWLLARPFLANLYNWFVTSGLPGIVAFITGPFTSGISSIANAISGMWLTVQPYLTQFYNWFVTQAIPVIGRLITNVLVPVLQDIGVVIGAMWATAQPVLVSLRNWFVSTGLPGVRSALIQFRNIVGTVGAFFIGMWALTRPVLVQLGRWFTSTVGPKVLAFWRNLRAAVRNTTNYVIGQVQRLIDAFNRIPTAQNIRNRLEAGFSGVTGLGRAIATGQVSAQEVLAALLRDKGGPGVPGQLYAIGQAAGVEAFVSPRMRGDFMPNVDRVMEAAAMLADTVAQGGNGGGTTNSFNITINANSEAEGRSAARGFNDELVRLGYR